MSEKTINKNNISLGQISSTIIFLFALTFGLMIAASFVFFAIRYSIRSKYGLNFNDFENERLFNSENSLTDIQRQEIIMNSANVSNEIESDYNQNNNERQMALSLFVANRQRRHIRSSEQALPKKLKLHEMDKLFPKKTYDQWLDVKSIVKKENHDDDDKNETETVSNKSVFSVKDEKTNFEMLDSETNCFETENETGCSKNSEKKDEADDSKKTEPLKYISGICTICLSHIEKQDLVRGLTCGHVFHSDCLDPWFIKRRSCCPICKKSFIFKKQNNSKVVRMGNFLPSLVSNDVLQSLLLERAFYDLMQNSIVDNNILHETFHNLIPISERVKFILNDLLIPNSLLKQKAKEIAKKKSDGFFRLAWWKIMGITKDDLFNRAVIKLFYEYRNNIGSENNNHLPFMPQNSD